MDQKAPELEDALRRMTLHSMQRYRIQYFLARLSQHVDMAFCGIKGAESLDPYFKLEIEHILPNNPDDTLRADWRQRQPDLDYDGYKSRLGNLTLLEKPINIVAGRNYFADKIDEYAKSSSYLTRSLSALADVGKNTSISRINEMLASYDKWDAENIDDRQTLLLALAKEVWRTSPTTV
ncbi:MAG: HNH endonuclease family protein [Planktomarina sp.]